MNEDVLQNVSLRRVHRLLKTITHIAVEASMTGQLEDGARSAVEQYNAILNHLTRTGFVPVGLFARAPEDASMGNLGVSSKMLASYIEEDIEQEEKAPAPAGPPTLRELESVNLQELGALVREHLPELLRRPRAGD